MKRRIKGWWSDNYDVVYWLAGTLCGLIVGLFLLLVGLRQLEHYVDTRSCEGFAEASGREVRFVDYHFWDWGCLTPAADGSWIDVNNLRLNEEA